MTFEINANLDGLYFIPLGGVGEIGLNFYLYVYNGDILVVDLGLGFAGHDLPGVDIIIPDPDFLLKYKERIKGMIITHAHEDHIGAVPYFVNDLNVPIYSSRFTANFLRRKLEEFSGRDTTVITEIKGGDRIQIGNFDITIVGLNHSIPEMNALLIKAGEQTLLHTGDWKFDSDPVIEEEIDYSILQKIGDAGLDVLVCDSTNALTKGHSQSEGSVYDLLYESVAKSQYMVLVTTFASNIARIVSTIKVARKVGRKVAVVGRSFQRAIEVAKASGYLQGVDDIWINPEEVRNHNRSEVLVLCTGCQGEERGALSRIASGKHRDIKISSGDEVIFSSRIIPGNDKRIFTVVNSLVRQKIKVVTQYHSNIHASGHPYRDELKRMYELVRPKTVIPMHGEHVHIVEHRDFALQCGVPKAYAFEDGDCIKITQGGLAEKVAKVKVGYFGVDGGYLRSPNSDVMLRRRLMRESGVLLVSLAVSMKRYAVVSAECSAPGFLSSQESGLLEEFKKDIVRLANDILAGKNKQAASNNWRNALRDMVKARGMRFSGDVMKNPYIELHIVRID